MATQSDAGAAYDGNLAHAFLWPFKFIYKTCVIYFFLFILTIFFSEIFANYFWISDDHTIKPLERMEQTLRADYNRLSQITNYETVQNLSVQSANFSYWLGFKITKMHDIIEADTNELKRDYINSFDLWYVKFCQTYRKEILIAMYAVQIFGLRLGMMVSAIPLFILIWLAAASDGLAERYIRKACAGRESGDMFKLGRILQLFGFVFIVMFYVTLPINIDPLWVTVPMAIILSISTRAQFKFYKKYL